MFAGKPRKSPSGSPRISRSPYPAYPKKQDYSINLAPDLKKFPTRRNNINNPLQKPKPQSPPRTQNKISLPTPKVAQTPTAKRFTDIKFKAALSTCHSIANPSPPDPKLYFGGNSNKIISLNIHTGLFQILT